MVIIYMGLISPWPTVRRYDDRNAAVGGGASSSHGMLRPKETKQRLEKSSSGLLSRHGARMADAHGGCTERFHARQLSRRQLMRMLLSVDCAFLWFCSYRHTAHLGWSPSRPELDGAQDTWLESISRKKKKKIRHYWMDLFELDQYPPRFVHHVVEF